MIYLCSDQDKISKNIVTFKDRYELEQIRKSIKDDRDYSMSMKIIEECFVPRFQDQEVTNLLFFHPSYSMDTLRDIFLSDMSLDSKRVVINDMEQFKDFCFFSHKILDKIEVKEIGTYEIAKMEKIKQLSDEIGLISEASDILGQREFAEQNQKVLTLARRVRDL